MVKKGQMEKNYRKNLGVERKLGIIILSVSLIFSTIAIQWLGFLWLNPVRGSGNGDITITDTTYIIENMRYIHTGNITVDSGGTLLIRNSTLEFAQTVNKPLKLTIQNNGRLIMINSTVKLYEGTLNPDFNKFVVEFKNCNNIASTIIENSKFEFNGTVTVENSILYINNSQFIGPSQTIKDKAGNQDLRAPSLQITSGSKVIICDSILDRMYYKTDNATISSNMTVDNSELYVINSRIPIDFNQEPTPWMPGQDAHQILNLTNNAKAYLLNITPYAGEIYESAIVVDSTSTAYIYKWLEATVIDSAMLPIAGAKISLQYHSNDTIVNINPPSVFLDYLSKNITNYNYTGVDGTCSLPILTDVINTTSYPNSIFTGNFKVYATSQDPITKRTYTSQIESLSYTPYPDFKNNTNEATLQLAEVLLPPVEPYYSEDGVNFIIDNTDKITINFDFAHSGNIKIRDNGILTIQDAMLDIKQSPDERHYILIEDNGTLVLDNMMLVSNLPLNIYLYDNATLQIKSSTLYINAIGCRNNFTIYIENSMIYGYITAMNISNGEAYFKDTYIETSSPLTIDASKITVLNSTFWAKDLIFDTSGDQDTIYSKDSNYFIDLSGSPGNWVLGNPSPLVFYNATVTSINDTFSQSIDLKDHTVMNITTPSMADNTSVAPTRDDTSSIVVWYWLTVYVKDANSRPIDGAEVRLYGMFDYDDPGNNPYVPRLIRDVLLEDTATVRFMVRAYINDTFVGNYLVNASKYVNGTLHNSTTNDVIMYGNNDTIVLFTTLKPDLVVEGITLSNPTPSVSNIVDVYIDIKNTGFSGATNFYVDIYTEPSSLSTTVLVEDTIKMDESYRVTIQWVPEEAKTYLITVEIDAYNNVTEINEQNNVQTLWVNVVPMPDLLIEELTASMDQPIVNKDLVYFNATIYNDGETDLTNVTVELRDGDIPINSTKIDIAASSYVEVSFAHTFAIAAVHTIWICVDPEDIINESDEDNNNQSIYITVINKPDIAITSDDITLISDNFVNGTELTVIARVSCTGALNNISVDISFYIDYTILIHKETIIINASEAKNVTAVWPVATPAGWHNVTVIIDENNTVDESNENNNMATKQFYLKSGPDLAIYESNITIEPTDPSEGEEVTISVVVFNKGESDLSPDSNIRVNVSIDDQFHDSLYISEVLEAGDSIEVTFGVKWLAVEGDHIITVEVDPENILNEANESNNIASIYVHVYSKPELYILVEDIVYEVIETATGDYDTIHETDLVGITAMVWNSGEGTARNVTIGFLIDGEYIDLQTDDIPHSITEGTLFYTEWYAEGGLHEISVIVDVYNAITEDNESNNQASIQIEVEYLPELNIDEENIEIEYSVNTKVREHLVLTNEDNEDKETSEDFILEGFILEGAVLNATVPVRNTGRANATYVNITVVYEYYNFVTNDWLWDLVTYNVTNITHGDTYLMQFSISNLLPGGYTITLIIDPEEEVTELNEENNTYTFMFVVYPKPDLSINVNAITSTYKKGNESMIVENEPVFINVTVFNNGTFDVLNITASLFIFSNESGVYQYIPVYNITIDRINASNITYLIFNYTPPVLPKDREYQIFNYMVQIDVYNNITDANPGNNTFEFMLNVSKKPHEKIVIILDIRNKNNDQFWYSRQTGYIYGTVYFDDDPSQPVANATIILTIAGVTYPPIKTDSDGYFTFVLDEVPIIDKREDTFYYSIEIEGYDLEIDVRGPAGGILVKKVEKPKPVDIWPYVLALTVVVIIIIIALVAYTMMKKKALAESGGARCSVCGEIIPIDATVCPKCGTEFGDMVECGNCGAVIPADSKSCPSCGVAFEVGAGEFGAEMLEEVEKEEEKEEEVKEEEEKVEEEEEGMMKCYACGEMIPVESTSCPYCGTVFEEEVEEEEEIIEEVEEGEEEIGEEAMIECFNCGKSIPLTATKCPYCGTEFE